MTIAVAVEILAVTASHGPSPDIAVRADALTAPIVALLRVGPPPSGTSPPGQYVGSSRPDLHQSCATWRRQSAGDQPAGRRCTYDVHVHDSWAGTGTGPDRQKGCSDVQVGGGAQRWSSHDGDGEVEIYDMFRRDDRSTDHQSRPGRRAVRRGGRLERRSPPIETATTRSSHGIPTDKARPATSMQGATFNPGFSRTDHGGFPETGRRIHI